MTTLPPAAWFGGNNLVRAREHAAALRDLGAIVYELDTTAAYAKDWVRLDQQKRDLIDFGADALIGTPHAGYAVQPFTRTETNGRPGGWTPNLLIDELELPLVAFWDHALTQAAHYVLRPYPEDVHDSRDGALQTLRGLFSHPNIAHFFPDSGHALELSRLGLGSFGEDSWYVQAIGRAFMHADPHLVADNRFDNDVAFFGNVYLAAAKQISYASDPAVGQLRERAREICANDLRASNYQAYLLATAELEIVERERLRLVPDQSFYWRFLFEELSHFVNGEERLRRMQACGKPVVFFGNFNDPDSNAMMPPTILLRGVLPYGSRLAESFRRSRVTVDVANGAFVNGFSVKLVDCFAAGGFALTSHKNDLTRAFGPVADEICYDDAKEFADKLDFFLGHDRRRRELSREIGDIARQNYSAEALFAQTLPTALERIRGRIVRRKRKLFGSSDTALVMLATIDLGGLSTELHWLGARIFHGNPAIIETTNTPWGYSARLPLARLRLGYRGNGNPLLWQVDAEIYTGEVGLGLIDSDALITERLLNAADGRKVIYLPASTNTADLLVRNGSTKEVSRIAIHAVRLVQSGNGHSSSRI